MTRGSVPSLGAQGSASRGGCCLRALGPPPDPCAGGRPPDYRVILFVAAEALSPPFFPQFREGWPLPRHSPLGRYPLYTFAFFSSSEHGYN